MSFLSALPKELLLEIPSYLPPLSIEALAQNFRYNITPTCLPFLTSLVARRRHIKTITAQFGPFSFRVNRDFAHVLGTATKLNLTFEEERCMRNPKQTEIPYRMEHLDWVFEIDTLAWLARMPSNHVQHAFGAPTTYNRNDMLSDDRNGIYYRLRSALRVHCIVYHPGFSRSTSPCCVKLSRIATRRPKHGK
jgi:hypothetical protein